MSSVAEAMIRSPKVCGPATTVQQASQMLADDHFHAVLIVEGGTLLAVVEAVDLAGTARPGSQRAPAQRFGRLSGRVVRPDDDLDRALATLVAQGRRRFAVVDECGALLGLLCLKRAGHGFCSDADVRERAADPHPAGR